MNTRMTLREMSKILGYSKSTISKALNDSQEISESTKARVKQAARLYQYVPNEIAQSLKNNNKVLSISVPKDRKQICERLLEEIKDISEKATKPENNENNSDIGRKSKRCKMENGKET